MYSYKSRSNKKQEINNEETIGRHKLRISESFVDELPFNHFIYSYQQSTYANTQIYCYKCSLFF